MSMDIAKILVLKQKKGKKKTKSIHSTQQVLNQNK